MRKRTLRPSVGQARSLEYFVVKRFKPDGSLMPPALYQERCPPPSSRLKGGGGNEETRGGGWP